VRQIDEFFPIVEEAIRTIDSKMKGLVSVARAQAEPAEVPLIERAIGEYNDQMGRLVGLTADLRRPMDDVKATCQALQSIREAGERWLERVVPENCDPLAENLRRENMQGFFSFSWKSLAVEDYWNHVDRHQGSALALSDLGSQIGDSLISLADAIDRENTELMLAKIYVLASVAASVAAAAAMYSAIGGAAGAPFLGAGAVPGAAIGAIVGIVVGLIVAFSTLLASLQEYDQANRITVDAGVEELRELRNAIRSASLDVWAGNPRFFEGERFRQA
jgi:hypothetical protein